MELPITVSEFPIAESVYDEISMEEELDELKNSLLKATNEKIKIRTINIVGSVEYELKELCKIEQPFAVVMGTHTNSVLGRLFSGSTTLYSARRLDCPVLIVPPGVSYKPIQKVALASDLRNIYSMPLTAIDAILTTFHASFSVFHVQTKQKGIEKDSVESLLLTQRLSNLKPQFFTVENENVERGVEMLAQRNAVDLVLIIPRKHGLFHRAKSNEFIFHSSVPVMTIHEEELVPETEDEIFS
jgi:hypothetical protein